jgi:hypothetical protein
MLRRMTSCGALSAGDDRADAEDRRQDRLGLRPRELLTQLGQMPAGDVPGLMRKHADDLVRRLRLHQCAGIDEDAAAVDDEGVERSFVDDNDLHVLLGQAGSTQERRGVVAQQLLDLGIADDRRALGCLRQRRDRRQRQRGRGDQRGCTAQTRAKAEARDIGCRNSHVGLLNAPLPGICARRPASADRYIAGFGSRANTLNLLESHPLQAAEYGNMAARRLNQAPPFKRRIHCVLTDTHLVT